MNAQENICPSKQQLQQFLLGHLPDNQIEITQQHLSECDPCLETVEGLKVDDTFSDLTRQALEDDLGLTSDEFADQSPAEDRNVIERMMSEAESWKTDSSGAPAPHRKPELLNRAIEVHSLLQSAEHADDVGQIAHFRVQELLGTGSTGVVYRAIDTRLDRNVVLKVLRPSLGEQARTRFVAEAKATAAIEHPNVVTIYEVGSDGPLSYIAMQWIPGQTLEQKLATEETLPLEETKRLVSQLAGGLAAAHQHSLIHRDIKPGNIWIPDQEKEAQILDFGLVRVADEDPQLTCTGMIAGTPCYMSPEQSRGETLDGRSDLFSLGCVMYQCLTGKLPFRADNALATLRSIQQDHPTAPNERDPSIPGEISDLAMCLLEKSATRRPPSAEAVINAVNKSPEHWDFALAAPIKPTRSNQHATSSFLWKSLAAMLAVLAVVAIGMNYQQIFQIVTNQGKVEIETMVDDVKIEFVQDGQVVKIVDLATKQSVVINAGRYEIRPVGDNNSVTLNKNQLTLSRGEKEIVRVTDKRDANSLSDPVDKQTNPWVASDKLCWQLKGFEIQHMPAEEAMLTVRSILGGDSTDTQKLGMHIDDRLNTLWVRIWGNHDRVMSTRIEKIISEIDQPQKTVFDASKPHKVQAGDVLGVFVDGVLGEFAASPPIHLPTEGSGLQPTVGFPVPVDYDGTIDLPIVKPIKVRGKTILEVRKLVNDVFKTGEQPILRESARIIVNLMQTRQSRRQLANTATQGQQNLPGFNSGSEANETADALSSFENAGSSGPGLVPSEEISGSNSEIARTEPIGTPGGSDSPVDLLQAANEVSSSASETAPSDPVAKLKEKAVKTLADFESGKTDELTMLDSQTRLLEELSKQPEVQNDIQFFRSRLETVERYHRLLQTSVADGSKPAKEIDALKVRLGDARKRLGDARISLSKLERSTNSQQTQPVYDGKTYEELLAIVRRERDLTQLTPAIKGIANLAEGFEKPEMIEAIMQVARRGVGVASDEAADEFEKTMQKVLHGLDLETGVNAMIREIEIGNRLSLNWYLQYSIRPCFRNALPVLIAEDPETFHELEPKFLTSIGKLAEQDWYLTVCSEFLVETLGRHAKELGPSNQPIVEAIFAKYIEKHSKNPHNYFDEFIDIAEIAPETHGLVDFVKNQLNELRSKYADNPKWVVSSHSPTLYRTEKVLKLWKTLPDNIRPNNEFVAASSFMFKAYVFKPTTTRTYFESVEIFLNAAGFDYRARDTAVKTIGSTRNGVGSKVGLEIKNNKIRMKIKSDIFGEFEFDQNMNSSLTTNQKLAEDDLVDFQTRLAGTKLDGPVKIEVSKKTGTLILKGAEADVAKARKLLDSILNEKSDGK